MSETKDYHEYYNRVFSQDYGGMNPSRPFGWIQWKGTAVCIDLHCTCGHHGHVDEEFFYYYECPKCKKLFAVGQNIKLIELSPEDEEFIRKNRSGVIKTSEGGEL